MAEVTWSEVAREVTFSLPRGVPKPILQISDLRHLAPLAHVKNACPNLNICKKLPRAVASPLNLGICSKRALLAGFGHMIDS